MLSFNRSQKVQALFAFILVLSCLQLKADDLLEPRMDFSVHPSVTVGNGSSDKILVQKQSVSGSTYNHHAGVLEYEFNASEFTGDVTLFLDVAAFDRDSSSSPDSMKIYVWAMVDGASLVELDEDTAYYNHVNALLDRSNDGVRNSHASLAGSMGTFTVYESDLGGTVEFSSAELTQLVADDTDGIITLFLTGYSGGDEVQVGFATKENSGYGAPRLFVEMGEEIATPTIDAYIKYKYHRTYSSEDQILLKRARNGKGNTTRKGVLLFDLSQKAMVKDVNLLLDLDRLDGASSSTVYVWALEDASALNDPNSLGQFYTNGVFDQSSDGVDNSDAYVYNDGQMLGSFTVTSADLNDTVAFRSDRLIELINDDSDGRIAIMLTLAADDIYTAFAANEHSSLNPPRLWLEHSLEEETASADMAINMIDVDNDGEEDLTLRVNAPGGGGWITADPFIIADYLIQIGFGLGDSNDFEESLSSTQQTSLTNTVVDLTGFTPAAGITESFLEGMIAIFGYESRDYPVTWFDTLATIDEEIESGSLGLAVESGQTASYATGDLSAGVTFTGTQAGLSFSGNGIAFGAANTYFGVSVGYGNENGTYVGVSASYGSGYWVAAKWGQDGQYGFSAPIPTTPFGITLYVEGDDALAAYNLYRNLALSTASQTADFFNDRWVNAVDLGNDIRVMISNGVADTKVYLANKGESAYIWVSDGGEEIFVYLSGGASTVANAMAEVGKHFK